MKTLIAILPRRFLSNVSMYSRHLNGPPNVEELSDKLIMRLSKKRQRQPENRRSLREYRGRRKFTHSSFDDVSPHPETRAEYLASLRVELIPNSLLTNS